MTEKSSITKTLVWQSRIYKHFCIPELPVSTFKEPKVSPKLRVYLRSRGKKCRTFQTKDEDEWHEYFSLLNSLCGVKKLEVKEKAAMKKENEVEKKEVNAT